MASVKYAISAYVADGTTTDYLITWDYLDEAHIAVYVDGTSNADPTASHTFSKLNDTTLRITDELGNAIAAGSEIEIRRETPLTTRAITFADGSALLAADLNKNSDYLLYSMQEVLDTVDAAAQDGALAAQTRSEEILAETTTLKNTTETLKNTTAGYLATVQSDATDADNHRIAAAASEAAAASSEANAATSETNSATSATDSANSASASAASAAASLASELAAAASETAAAASEVAAAASETAAAASEAAAATSEANAAASFDSFDDRYLGAKATAPSADNDGNPLITGALYWNSTSDTMYVWNGSLWDTFSSTTGISDAATSSTLYIQDGKLGIDTVPAQELHVKASSALNADLRLEGNNGTAGFMDVYHGSSDCGLYSSENVPMRFFTNDTERLKIYGDGRVSMGGAANDADDALRVNGYARFGSPSGGNTGVKIDHGSGANEYGAIRFYEANVNKTTIHTFSDAWYGGDLNKSGGCFNVNGSKGVTIGSWDNPVATFNQTTKLTDFKGEIQTGGRGYIGETWHRYDTGNAGAGSFNCDSSWHYALTGLNGHFNGQFTVSHSSGGVHTTGIFFIMITYATGIVYKFTSGSGYSQDIEMRLTGSTYNYNIEIRTTTNYSGRTGYWRYKRFGT